jgi:hypothetical protein
MIMDDGFQVAPNAFQRMNLHYCYFLDSAYGGPGDSGTAAGPMYISHCIFDNRCPRLVDCTNPQGEPFFMPLMQTHFTGGCQQPLKWYNNTIIWAPDTQGAVDSYMNHITGNENATIAWHETFNNIYVRIDYQRYTGTDFVGNNWMGHQDEVVSSLNCGGESHELYDYEILHRDVPNPASPFFKWCLDSTVHGQSVFSHGAGSYSSLANWLAGVQSEAGGVANKFNESKGIYAPGFHAHSFQVNPQIPSCPTGGSVPDFDTRRNYRPAASQANNGFSGTTNAPSGESMAGWKVKPSPWIGALNPGATDMPVGVQNP